MHSILRYLEPFRRESGVFQTDRLHDACAARTTRPRTCVADMGHATLYMSNTHVRVRDLCSLRTFSVTRAITIVNYISSETIFFGLDRRRGQYGPNFNYCVVIGRRRCRFRNTAKQRPLFLEVHSRSLILLPMKSPNGLPMCE